MMKPAVRSGKSISGKIGSILLLTGLTVSMVFPSAVFAGSPSTVMSASEIEKQYETESKYKVRVFSGQQGTFSSGKEYDYPEVSYGGTVSGEPSVTLPEGSKYFAKGFRESGKDSSYSGLISIGDLQSTINNMSGENSGVTQDVDYVVAYGMLSAATPYTVTYVDENERLLEIQENGVTLPNPMTYYGVKGDTVIVAAKQIDNWDVVYPARRQTIDLGTSKSTDAVFVYRSRAAATPTPSTSATPTPTAAPASGGGGGGTTSTTYTTTTTTGGGTTSGAGTTATPTPAAGTTGTGGTGGVNGTGTGSGAAAGLGTGTTATTSGTQTGTGGQNAAVDSAIRNAVQGAANRGASNLEPLPDTVNIDEPDVPRADFPGSSSKSSSADSSSSSSKSSSSDSKSSSSSSKSSSSSSISTSSSSTSATPTATPTPEPTQAPGGISTTAKIGIGAGVGIVLGAVIGGLAMRRRRGFDDYEDDEDDDE